MEEKAVEETEDEDETEAEVEVTSVGRHGGAPVAPEAVAVTYCQRLRVRYYLVAEEGMGAS